MVTTADLKFEDAFIYSSLLTLADVVALQRSATLEYCDKPKRWFTGWTLIRMSPITVFFDTLLELNSLWNYRRTDGLVDEPETKSWPWVELFLLLCEFVPWLTLIFAFGDVPIANVCAMVYLQGVIVHALHVRVVGKRFAKGKRAKTAYRCLLAAHILFFHVVLRALHARAPFGMQDVHETIQNLVTFNLGKVDWLVLDVLRKIVMPHLSYRWTSSGQYLLVQLYFLHNRMDYGFLNRYEPQVVQNALRYIVHESAWSALEGLIYVIPLQACAFGLWWSWSMLQWLFSKKIDKVHKE